MSEPEGFGVRLRPLTREDLEGFEGPGDEEDPEPRGVFGEPLTEEVRQRWLASIESDEDFASLVLWEEKPIGLTRVTGYDKARKTAEGEMFLQEWGRDRRGELRVAIVGTDWCFGELGLEAITSTVAKEDRLAIELNRALGHVFDPEVPDRTTLTSRLTRDAYQENRPDLVRRIHELEGFGIELRRLGPDDLELVRRWRNDPEIRRYMHFREHITEEMHRRWFESIDNERNHYSLVFWRGEPIGVSHVKDCDYVRKTGEGGFFLWAREGRDWLFALRVALVGTDWCFEDLGLETVTGTVLKDNRRAMRFNVALGHVFDPEVPGREVRTCRLTREAYSAARPRLVALIR